MHCFCEIKSVVYTECCVTLLCYVAPTRRYRHRDTKMGWRVKTFSRNNLREYVNAYIYLKENTTCNNEQWEILRFAVRACPYRDLDPLILGMYWAFTWLNMSPTVSDEYPNHIRIFFFNISKVGNGTLDDTHIPPHHGPSPCRRVLEWQKNGWVNHISAS